MELSRLPEASDSQRDIGWSRDWSVAWASHDKKLVEEGGNPEAWRSQSQEDEETPAGQQALGGRVQFFDFTGGPVVREAKARAASEQMAHERRQLFEWKARREQELWNSRPDVTRFGAAMPQATLKTGHKIPLIGLGTWKSEPGAVKAAVEAALHAGYTHVDCGEENNRRGWRL